MHLNNEQQKTYFREKAESLDMTSEFERHLTNFRDQMDAANAKGEGEGQVVAYVLALAYVVAELQGAM